MKKNAIWVLALSAVMLTGCGKENELIDKLETSDITYSEQLTQIYETEKKIIETEGDTQFIFGGETETSADKSENTETENGYSTDNISVKYFDYGSLAAADTAVRDFYEHNFFIRNNILGCSYGAFNENNDIEYQIRIFDMEENKLLTAIDLPDGYMTEDCICEANSGELCRYIINNVVYDEENDRSDIYYAVLTIHNDLTYDISEDYTPQSRSFECCGHNIAEWENDIVDTDSGGILIAGYDGTSEYDLYKTGISYDFPIDENRFVYNTLGHESLPSFGIYDFSTGTAADVPDSRDLVPIGVHDGKIYSVKTEWSGFGKDIYTTDIQTLETEFFTGNPFNAGEDDHSDYAEYAMPESGNYIAVLFTPDDTEKPEVLYGINPDTKEVVFAEIPNEFEHYSLHRFEENSVMISNDSGKVLIAEINF